MISIDNSINQNYNIKNRICYDYIITKLKCKQKNKEVYFMKLNTDDLKGHLSAVITVFQETTNIIFEDENNGRWIYFMLLRELEEILNDFDHLE